jgi:hypothetical protein
MTALPSMANRIPRIGISSEPLELQHLGEMRWRFVIAVRNRMRGSTQRIAKSYVCDGRNFTSRPADNYEHFSKFLQIDTRMKKYSTRRKNEEKSKRDPSTATRALAPQIEAGRTIRASRGKENTRESPLRTTGLVWTRRANVNRRLAPTLLFPAGGFEHVPRGVW